MKNYNYLMDVWSFDEHGQKLFPYQGQRGEKRGLYSVNFRNDTNDFIGLTESELTKAILDGKFRDRGTIRMLPLKLKPNMQRNAFAPKFYKGKLIKDI